MPRLEEDPKLTASRIYEKALLEDEFKDAWNAFHEVEREARHTREELLYLAMEGKFWEADPVPLDAEFEVKFAERQKWYAGRLKFLEKRAAGVKKACEAMVRRCENEVAYYRWQENNFAEKLKRGREAAEEGH